MTTPIETTGPEYEAVYGAVSAAFRERFLAAVGLTAYRLVLAECQAEINRRVILNRKILPT